MSTKAKKKVKGKVPAEAAAKPEESQKTPVAAKPAEPKAKSQPKAKTKTPPKAKAKTSPKAKAKAKPKAKAKVKAKVKKPAPVPAKPAVPAGDPEVVSAPGSESEGMSNVGVVVGPKGGDGSKPVSVEAITCLRCGDTIYSRAEHDMRWCSCDTIAVDGGFSYIKITGRTDQYTKSVFPVDASKSDLFLDWNNDINKFGLIKGTTAPRTVAQ